MEQNLCQSCPTRRLCLAAGLEGDALRRLSSCVVASSPMKRGDYLYRAGDTAASCFVVRRLHSC